MPYTKGTRLPIRGLTSAVADSGWLGFPGASHSCLATLALSNLGFSGGPQEHK